MSLTTGWRLEKEVAGTYVDVPAVLLSPRIQAFDVTAGASTAVAYEFKVAGEVVTLGGSLVISTNVVEESCQDDLAENNDTVETARSITVGSAYDLALCLGDEDYFVLDNVSGKKLTVDLAFLNAQGDLDVYITNENGVARGAGQSIDDGEHVVVEPFEGTKAIIRVVGFRNASNTYTLTTALGIAGQPPVPADWTCNVNYHRSISTWRRAPRARRFRRYLPRASAKYAGCSRSLARRPG